MSHCNHRLQPCTSPPPNAVGPYLAPPSPSTSAALDASQNHAPRTRVASPGAPTPRTAHNVDANHAPPAPAPPASAVRDEARVARSGRLRDLTQGTVSALSLGTRHDAQSRMDRTTTSRLLLAVRASARGNFLPRSCHSGTRHDPAAFQGGLAQGGRCRRPWLPAKSVLRHPVTPQMSKVKIEFLTPPSTRWVTRRPRPLSATATWRGLRGPVVCPTG